MEAEDEDTILTEALMRQMAHGAGGARFAARFMRKNIGEQSLTLPMPFEAALGHVYAVLLDHGMEARPQTQPDLERTRIVRVLTVTGLGGLTPVLVTVLVSGPGADSTELRIRAATQQGLIKRRHGEKAARHFAELLGGAGGAGGPGGYT